MCPGWFILFGLLRSIETDLYLCVSSFSSYVVEEQYGVNTCMNLYNNFFRNLNPCNMILELSLAIYHYLLKFIRSALI